MRDVEEILIRLQNVVRKLPRSTALELSGPYAKRIAKAKAQANYATLVMSLPEERRLELAVEARTILKKKPGEDEEDSEES